MWLKVSENRLSVPVLLASIIALSILAIGTFFYTRGLQIMEDALRNQLRSNAAVAAMQFDGSELQAISGLEDMNKPIFKEYVQRLDDIRGEIPNIEYAYIMRRTGDPLILEFVVDADSFQTPGEQDANGNGEIEGDEEISLPGDLYDISDVPAMQGPAFIAPTVDSEITYDQWGAAISGYAPITDRDGNIVAILGIDMMAVDFLRLSKSIFSAYALSTVFFLALILGFIVAVLFRNARQEADRKTDQERAALIGLALHQFGSPLAIFRWWVEILNDKTLREAMDQEEIGAQMADGVQKLDDVYAALQKADAMSSGHIQYTTQSMSLTDVLQEEVKQAKKLLTQRSQQLNLVAPEELEIEADRDLISGVIDELLQNAMYFSPEGSTITLNAKQTRTHIEVSVADQGIGISRSEQLQVFKKFVRGHAAHKYKPVGNGLGLYLAQRTVELAGGKIWIQSKEGKGTTVSFTIPLKKKKKWPLLSRA